MFNQFKGGIKDKKPLLILDIEDLVTRIRNNPQKAAIEALHRLEYGSPAYKSAKEQFPYLTPHGTFSSWLNDDNLSAFSGYMFFDLDEPVVGPDIAAFKQQLLQEYGSKICLLGKSIGGRGLFFYLSIANRQVLTRNNFMLIYEYFRTRVFGGLGIDNNAKGISRPQFIPWDDEVYYNPDATITIDIEFITTLMNRGKEDKKSIVCSINNQRAKCCTTKYTFLPIGDVLRQYKFSTELEVPADVLFLRQDVRNVKVFTSSCILDGQKHTRYRAIVHAFLYLNPGVDILPLLSYIHFLNTHYTGGKPMKLKELIRLVEHEYHAIQKTGQHFVTNKLKRIHVNKRVPKEERRTIYNREYGKLRRQDTYNKIKAAVVQLQQQGQKPAQALVAEMIGMSLPTVKKYHRAALDELQKAA